jgi:predicted XRE-type DNA-binding protein
VFWSNLGAGTSRSCGCVTRKLTPEQVKAIQADSRTQAEIAKAHGISQSVVSDVKTRCFYNQR